MIEFLTVIKIILATVILTRASILDWRYREIDDKTWVSMVLLGLVFLSHTLYIHRDLSVAIQFLFSFCVSILLAISLYYPGLIGEGDSRILIGIGAMFPEFPYPSSSLFPVFSLSVFANAIFLSVPIPIAFFFHNLKHLKDVKTLKGFFALFLGYEKMQSKIKDYEVIIGEGDKYSLFINSKKIELGKTNDHEKIAWVTPAIPFIILMTAGFLMSITYGDFVSYLLLH